MKALTIKKDEFNDILYPAIGGSAAESESELETALRVMRKLKNPSLTYEEDVDPVEAEKVRKQGGRLIAYKKLRVDEAVLLLEEDEHKLVLDRLKKFIPRVTLLAAEELYELIERVKNATEPKPEETQVSSGTSQPA